MAFSVNRLTLVGTVGKDPEIKQVGDTSVTSFSIATEHSYKDKSTQWQNVTTWHNITAWGVSNYTVEQIKKGVKVYLEGRIENQEYEKDGVKKYITKVIADSRTIIVFDVRGKSEGQPVESQNVSEAMDNYKGQGEPEDDSLPF